MSRKITKSGIYLLIIGGVLTIAGLVLFLRVFLSLSHEMNDPFFRQFGPSTFHRGPSPYQSGVVGVVLAGIGGYMVKLGLGLTLVGYSGNISNWIRRLWRGETATVTCPNCSGLVPGDPQYCSHCGTKLKEE